MREPVSRSERGWLQMPDRRRYRRLPLRLVVECRTDTTPMRLIERGLTSDISTGGLCFSSFNWALLPPGSQVRVTLSVSFESVIFTDRRQLTTRATVVRWVEEEPVVLRGRPPVRRGVALRFDEPLAFAA